jgi:hypothetical protein
LKSVSQALGKKRKRFSCSARKEFEISEKAENKEQRKFVHQKKNGLPTSWSTVPKMARFLQFEQPILINEKRENNVVS